MAEKLMTAQEVSDYLDVPIATIYRWRVHGQGPRGARIGRSLRFKRVDVERWLEQQLDASPAA